MNAPFRRAAGFVLVFLAASLAAPSPALARYHGNLNLFAGQKWMTKGDWEPLDVQPELGLMFAFGIERAPIHFALDVLASEKNETIDSPVVGPVDTKATTREYAVGVRKVWEPGGATRPFLAAGGCMVLVDLDFDAPGFHQSFGDNAYGLWIEGGVMWRVIPHMNLGLDVRYTHATAKFTRNGLPTDVDAGGFHAGVLIGYGW